MYTYNTKIGFSQTDTQRKIKLEALISLFQDATCFQGEEIGAGFDYLEPQHLAWIINSWQIEVKRFPRYNETVTVGTFPTSFKGFLGTRNFFVKDETGERIVEANSIWTLMDMETMRPAKIGTELQKKYVLEEPLPMEYLSRKILLPNEEGWQVTEEAEIKVAWHYLDSNMHVNNGQYVQIACGYLPVNMIYKRLRVEYRAQAHLGDVFFPILYQKEGTCIVALCDKEKKPYAVIEAQ